ncbi:hypothetical protein FQN55_009079 [Onygenales sp. PD_40]|nr:hypothetical protein FQN55_009079 [Onygenales sp. PD_40]KAK2772232.1 hypothetical protein FQN53_004693 [Emmonsiellopsis sp. PD_33]KAK2785748.1 hypothetical protein FQN52_008298 [Onygenales sp. PD_12]
MKPLLLTYLLLLFSTVLATSALRILPQQPYPTLLSRRRLLPRNLHIPTNLNPIPPRYSLSDDDRLLLQPANMGNKPSRPAADGSTSAKSSSKSPLHVSDILSKTREINVFSSLTRDIESISARLNDGSQNTTVLAPLNSAIQSLPRKPWEDPQDYEQFGREQAYAGAEGEGRAQRNLRRFVEAHMVPVTPWGEGEAGKVKTVGGGEVRWEKKGGKIFIQPGNVEVQKIAKKVSNGEVWILKGIINYV